MNFEFTFGKTSSPPTPETPFRILILGDLDGRTSRNLTQPWSDRRPVPVDLDSLEPVLKRLHAEMQLGGSGPSPISLAVSEPDDFHPDRLYERMELFTSLRATRKRLLDPATFAVAAAEVRAWGGPGPTAAPDVIPAAKPAPPAGSPARETDSNTLERLLGHAPAPSPVPSNVAAELIRKAVAPHIVAAPSADRPVLLAAVDAAAAELMRGVLHDPAFQALESTWRGLDFLVHRLDLNESLTVSLLNLSRAELLADLMSVEDLQQSALFRILVEATVQSPGAEPWALVLGLYNFDQSAPDRDLLERLAKLAQAAGAPFVAAAGAALRQTVVQNPDQLMADKAWMSLRTCPAAASLGLIGPRFLLRLPYGRATDAISAFDFEEITGQPVTGDYLWGNPALALGVLLGQMFAETGWDMCPGGSLELGDLPVHSWKAGTESQMTPCAEVWLKDAAAERLLEHGVMPLQSIQGKDASRLARVQSFHQPLCALAGRWTDE